MYPIVRNPIAGTNKKYLDYLDYNGYFAASQTASPIGVMVSPDGTRMSVGDGSGGNITNYTMSVGHDLTTAVYDNEVSAQGASVWPSDWNGDGSEFVYHDAYGDKMVKDVSASGVPYKASYTSPTNFNITTNNPIFQWIDNGNRSYIAGNQNGKLDVHTHSVPYDITTFNPTPESTIAGPFWNQAYLRHENGWVEFNGVPYILNMCEHGNLTELYIVENYDLNNIRKIEESTMDATGFNSFVQYTYGIHVRNDYVYLPDTGGGIRQFKWNLPV